MSIHLTCVDDPLAIVTMDEDGVREENIPERPDM